MAEQFSMMEGDEGDSEETPTTPPPQTEGNTEVGVVPPTEETPPVEGEAPPPPPPPEPEPGPPDENYPPVDLPG